MLHLHLVSPLISFQFVFDGKMKNFVSIRCVLVLVAFVDVVCITLVLRGVVEDTRKLDERVRVWRAAGPHTTRMGKMREHLSTAWWLGPLRLGSPRDPLVECDIPVGSGWREVLHLMVGIKERLVCLEWQIQMAEMEHKMFLVAVCVVLVPVFGVVLVLLLAGWTWARQTLTRYQHRHVEGTKQVVVKKVNSLLPLSEPQHWMQTLTCEENVRRESFPLERCVIAVIHEVMTHDGVMQRKGKVVCFEEDFLRNGHITGHAALVPLGTGVTFEDAHRQQSHGHDVAPECVAEPQGRCQQDAHAPEDTTEGQNTEKDLVSVEKELQVVSQQEADPKRSQCPLCSPNEAQDVVRRSLVVPRRFRERLVGPGECFFHYLQDHYSVRLFQDWLRSKLHIKGSKTNVLECYTAIRSLLAEWQTRETAHE